MALPRSIKGFESAIEKANEELAAIDQELQTADADSPEEEDLLAKKAEKSVELAELEMKFEEFKEKQKEGSEGDNSEDDEQSEQPKDDEQMTKSETQTEKKWPETMYVAVRNDIGYMVNPYNHIRITTDFKKVALDNWTISQIEAGFLIVDKD